MAALAERSRHAWKLWDLDPQAVVFFLKSCLTAFDGTLVHHALIVQSPFHSDRFLANMLIDTYGHFGALDDALATFSSIPQRNVFSWNIIMRACVKNGHARQTLFLFDNMLQGQSIPDRVTFLSALSACAHLEDLQEARRMEACFARSNVNQDVVVSSSLINMYYKCGSLADAERIFDTMQERDVVSWNTMIAAYAQRGQGRKALSLFDRMVHEGLDPSQATYCTLFRLCAERGFLDEGRHLHAFLKKGNLALDIVLGNALICMHSKAGSMQEAYDVFDSMHNRDLITWSTIMSVHINNVGAHQAIQLYYQMQMEGFIADTAIITISVCVCTCVPNLTSGKRFHACLFAADFISDLMVSTALINMYGKCKCVERAQAVFDGLLERDMVVHNAMISAYGWCGLKKECLQHFHQMHLESALPAKGTFASTLDACGKSVGNFMHAQLLVSGFNVDNEVGTSLISMYGKHGRLKQAERVLDELVDADVVVWNAMITICVHLEFFKRASQYLEQLLQESFLPNAATFASSFCACVSLAALTDGKRLHAIVVGASLQLDVIVATALINMYAKCGSLKLAQIVFDALPQQGGVTWNALVAAYAQHGRSKEALHLFNVMLSQGMCLDNATFSSVLAACSRAGYADEGIQCFISMLQNHGIRPTVQHYNCLIDLVSRAGRLDEGESVMSLMPTLPIDTSWTAMLGACRMHLDFERGKRIAIVMSALNCRSD